MRVKLRAFTDRSFIFHLKPPPTVWFLKRCSGESKGAAKPGQQVTGQVSIKYIYEIAKIKQELDPDMKHVSLRSICRVNT